jgi:hypothetical protein
MVLLTDIMLEWIGLLMCYINEGKVLYSSITKLENTAYITNN